MAGDVGSEPTQRLTAAERSRLALLICVEQRFVAAAEAYMNETARAAKQDVGNIS